MDTGGIKLTEEVKRMIGAEGDFVEASSSVVEKEGIRRFTQAIMDPDPRYWDEEFSKNTRYGEVVAPHIYATYLNKTAPWERDHVSEAFKENPISDGGGGIRRGKGSLPPIPTDLARSLNAGNEIEVFRFPNLGDRIYSQGRYADIIERIGRDGSHMLIATTETHYYNQRGHLLCITRASGIRR